MYRGVPCGRLSASELGASGTGFAACPTARAAEPLLVLLLSLAGWKLSYVYLQRVAIMFLTVVWKQTKRNKTKSSYIPTRFCETIARVIMQLSMIIPKERAAWSPGKQLCGMLNSFSSPSKTELNLSSYSPPFKKAFFDQDSGNHIALPFFLAPESVSDARAGPGNWIHLFPPKTYRAAIIHHSVPS